MRILRVRRGFTTNSSASSEWIPPEPGSGLSNGGGSAGPALGQTQIIMPVGTRHDQGPGFSADSARVGGLISAVALLFALERAGKRLFKKRPGDTDE